VVLSALYMYVVGKLLLVIIEVYRWMPHARGTTTGITLKSAFSKRVSYFTAKIWFNGTFPVNIRYAKKLQHYC